MAKLTLLTACLAFTGMLCAQQNLADTAHTARAIEFAKDKYDSQRAQESAIYNGIQFYPYLHSIEGIAFFQTQEWYKGNIVYDDVLYKDMFLKYDLVKDRVVITPDSDGGLFVSLFTPRVSEFTFSGFKFLLLGQPADGSSLPLGFYRQLTTGKVVAFSKHTKWITEQIVDQAIYRKFEEKTRYYVLADGVYHSIKNSSALLDLLKKHKKEIQQLLSDRKLKFRREPEQTIILAVEFYNQLEN